MTKMKKRFWAVVLTVAMALSCLSTVAFAAAPGVVENQLKDSHKNIYAGDDFQSLEDWKNLYNPLDLNVDQTNPAADFSYWHFVDSSDQADYATITFKKPDGTLVTWNPVPTTCNNSDKYGKHYAVITPSDWQLADGTSYSAASGEFNLSHSGRHEAEKGTVTVNAFAKAWHMEITPHEYWDRTVDTFYERNVDEFYERDVKEYYERTVDEYYERPVYKFYERDVDEYYERDVDEYYERPVTDIYQRYAVKYFVPVFEKKLEGAYNDTLVTRLEYSDNTVKAKPTNGGAFKNGHTYVTVDVAEASAEKGVNFTIADSSKDNGKKTPDEYNRPIDYTYNVKIVDGKLTITCPDDLAYASVGAYVWDKAPKDAKNAPKHYENTVTVNLPKNDGTVDLYVHFGKLGWYDFDKDGNPIYQFKEWKYDHTEEGRDWVYVETTYGDYELVNTVYGVWEKVDTQYGEYELVKTTYGDYALVDTKYGNYELVDTQYGDWEKADTVYGDYELVDTKYGEYQLIGTDTTSRRVDDEYTGTLTLKVDGEVIEAGAELQLTPGEHTFTLEGEGFEIVTKVVDIKPGKNAPIVLSAEVRNADVILDTDVVKADRDATPHYADREAVRHEENRQAEKNYADKEATRHEADGKVNEKYADRTSTIHTADRPTEKHYADGEVTELKKEEFIYRPDIKLGSEDDPDSEYAVKLN